MLQRDLGATYQKVLTGTGGACPSISCVSTTVFVIFMILQVVLLIGYNMYRWVSRFSQWCSSWYLTSFLRTFPGNCHDRRFSIYSCPYIPSLHVLIISIFFSISLTYYSTLSSHFTEGHPLAPFFTTFSYHTFHASVFAQDRAKIH